MTGQRDQLVVVSNRVSGLTGRGAPGAQGGLAGALEAVLKRRGGTWCGWSGNERGEFTGDVHINYRDGIRKATIDLEPQDVEEYYNGYANSTIWPLFHCRLDLTRYERNFGKGYERVNKRITDCAAQLIGPGDLVWVHDYHLMALGKGLRMRGIANRIGFFLHIPWPPVRLFSSLPFHERLVSSLLKYDLIGFQCDEWLENFLHYCRKDLGAAVDEQSGRIKYEGVTTHARVYPVGIDFDHFTALADTPEAQEAAWWLRSSTRERIAMIGVDRLDYSKGLPERLDGIGCFFERHPERTHDLVFVQIAPPSREDVKSYRDIRARLERKTRQINDAFSEVEFDPIRYVKRGFSQAQLYGLYRAARIALVTPLRDGMNLVAKEYVAAQDRLDPGVLILSRFAGAARQLDSALIVNPHNPVEIAQAIRAAMDMPLEERRSRWERLADNVRDENVHVWAGNFLHDLESV
ncbi:alpha,alpha-trehalose-phosphate synthase (UDP-forming) [Denitromonas iodatirespirans]|uniref:Trehalose-6-phosphate synthase n=1 Tax=Denitromonas iodatirespirans TaxID=2795389 RepID=A0A944H9I4_DENI1|nr:trehalose-6-phosphate synthase [Denitromonas iodatirespirans]MBT0959542.1 trehalose-6-phosphate synthase [Denitromonas iodatirespirans]